MTSKLTANKDQPTLSQNVSYTGTWHSHGAHTVNS